MKQANLYKSYTLHQMLDKLDVIEPNIVKRQEYADAYARWKHRLEKSMGGNV